jgi:predicted amidohydrolase
MFGGLIMTIRLAAVQLRVQTQKPKANLARIEYWTKKAARKGASVVVFPEDCITGPVKDCDVEADQHGTYRKTMQGLAKRYHIDVVAGSIVERQQGKKYGTSYYIDKTGRILLKYQKRFLWWTEKDYLTPGQRPGIVKTTYGRVGILICSDMMFSVSWDQLLASGVEVAFCPSYWAFSDARGGLIYKPKAEVAFVNALCTARAFDHELAVVFCNAARDRQPRRLAPIGRTQISLPFFGTVARLNHHREGMLVQNLETHIMKVAEASYQIREDSHRRRHETRSRS